MWRPTAAAWRSQRGPIVYAAEWVDNPDGKVRNLMLPDTAKLTAEFQPDAAEWRRRWSRARPSRWRTTRRARSCKTEQDFTAIPYYAWANRGRGQMMVWIPNTRGQRQARCLIPPGDHRQGHRCPASRTAAIPKRSTTARFLPAPTIMRPTSIGGPRAGNKEWVEYDFEKPADGLRVRTLLVRRHRQGSVRVPASWRLLYKDGDEWKPVEAECPRTESSAISSTRSRSQAVATQALRLELTAQEKVSAGIQKWKVK